MTRPCEPRVHGSKTPQSFLNSDMRLFTGATALADIHM